MVEKKSIYPPEGKRMTMRKGKSFVASLMALALVVTAMPSNVFAQSTSERTNYSIHGAVEVDESSVLDELWKNEETVETPVYGEDEMVTLIVELEDAPVMDFYDVETYSTDGTATVGEAVADFLASEEVQEVSDELLENQEELIASIEELVEDSEDAQMEVHAQWTIATNAISISVPYGIFELQNIREIIGITEKPSYHYYANAGIYLIKKELLNLIPENEYFDATDFMDELIKNKKKVIRFPITGYWIDIGKPEDFKSVQEFARNLGKQ